MGIVLDRFGVTRVGRVSTLLWSVFSLVTAAVSSFGMLFAARLGLGLAETPAFPINSKATGYWFPTGERGVATAIFDSAAKLSTAIGVPFVSLILRELAAGARRFSSTGIVSFLFFVAFFVFYRNPSNTAAHPRRTRVHPRPAARNRKARPPAAASAERSSTCCAKRKCGD